MLIAQEFLHPDWDSRLRWINPPPYCMPAGSSIVVRPAAHTDFWQRTHYGFQADTGHFLALLVPANFTCETELIFYPVHQYDQAGLMVRLSPECWLKTSVEYEPNGPSRLGVVVTNNGYSDWSTQNFDPAQRSIAFLIQREGSDYMVFYRVPPSSEWIQIRVAHLIEDTGKPVLVGLYACCPNAEGFQITFNYFTVQT